MDLVIYKDILVHTLLNIDTYLFKNRNFTNIHFLVKHSKYVQAVCDSFGMIMIKHKITTLFIIIDFHSY